MKLALHTATLLIALLMGVVPPGSCTSLLLNPHRGCCHSSSEEAATDTNDCCKGKSGCSSHKQSQQPCPDPYCSFTPSTLTFVEGSSATAFVADAPLFLAPDVVSFSMLDADSVAKSLYAHAPPGATPPCPSYLRNLNLLV